MQAGPLYSPSRALKLKLHASLFTQPPSLASYTLTSTFASSTGVFHLNFLHKTPTERLNDGPRWNSNRRTQLNEEQRHEPRDMKAVNKNMASLSVSAGLKEDCGRVGEPTGVIGLMSRVVQWNEAQPTAW